MTAAFSIKRSRLLCALAIFAPLTSLADDTLVVTVKPQTAVTPTDGYTAKTSQSATKSDKPLVLTAQSVSVVTRQQMNDQNPVNVNEALNYTPGVFTNFSGGATRYDTISLRGFHGGDVNNTFLDGLRLMSDGASYNALQIDPWFLDRIDVVKGPSSTLYGQSIPGGLVNMTTKRPQFANEGHFRLQGGNNNTMGGAFDYTDAINDEVAFRLTGMTRTSDTMYDHQREERYAISPSLLYQPNEDTSLLLRAYLQKDPSGGYHSAVPAEGSIYSAPNGKLPRSFFDGDSEHNVFKRWQQIYSYELTHNFNDSLTFRQNASYTHSNTDLEQVYQIGWTPDYSMMNRWFSAETSSLNAYTVDNQLEADFNTAALVHKLTFGLDYQSFTNDTLGVSAPASQLNPYTGEQVTPVLDDYTRTPNTRRYRQTGAYLQDDISLDNWNVILGTRYDRMVTKNTTPTDTGRRQDDYISARGSVLYHFESGFSPYVSYSDAITPSTLQDSTGNLLTPMTSKQYEIGLKYQQPGSSSLYSIAAYDLTQNDVTNRIVQGSYNEPVGKVHSQGVELEARSKLTDRLSGTAAYTYNNLKYKETVDGTDGNTPYLAPRHMASLWAQYDAGLGINLGAGVRYIGKQWADNQNTLRVPAATLLDASVRMNMDSVAPSMKGAYVQLNVNNLTDREYVAGCYGTGYCYWGTERTVVATVGYDF